MKLMNGMKEPLLISKLSVLPMTNYQPMSVVTVTNYSHQCFWVPRTFSNIVVAATLYYGAGNLLEERFTVWLNRI